MPWFSQLPHEAHHLQSEARHLRSEARHLRRARRVSSESFSQGSPRHPFSPPHHPSIAWGVIRGVPGGSFCTASAWKPTTRGTDRTHPPTSRNPVSKSDGAPLKEAISSGSIGGFSGGSFCTASAWKVATGGRDGLWAWNAERTERRFAALRFWDAICGTRDWRRIARNESGTPIGYTPVITHAHVTYVGFRV